ncbi:hypothetical protein [Alteromonas hispanica]|uniref:Uncharacterized protein n=1 Tax=Alteromonas hispanica TaxID=315421 RepID=A0A6L9MS40_9ALTE|nr:hypothetical protein [Alteromonas hispanica]NDW20999.1 hypothetical protein [Alteromonas hispanica]
MTEDQESFFVNLIEKELQSRDDDQELIEVDTMLTQISMKLKAKVAELVVEEAEEEEYLDVEFF